MYQLFTVHCFKDMSSRDLLQRRTTDSHGNTEWHHSTLVQAALHGGLCVLDGVDRLPPSTLACIRSLLEDRALDLFDGTRLMRADRFEVLVQETLSRRLHPTRAEAARYVKETLRILPIPPSFRISMF
jgi:hypothetical protein